jgi:hypothetical protein
MNPDRHLIDTIKAHFAYKSSAQLQEIVRALTYERWSAEAVAAAGEVLQARRAGLAQEPEVPEEERPPPLPSPADPFSLAFLALGALGGLTGFWVIPVYRVDDAGGTDPDLPVPFGPKMAWLALDTTDTQAVAGALGLRGARAATWAEGINAAHQASVFVTPPLGEWTLAVGAALFPPDRADAFVKPLLERLSRQFGETQYFCTHRDFELHVWARARKRRLVRGYGWLGQKGLTLWDEGAPTKEERDLGFPPPGGRSPGVEPAQNTDLTTAIVSPDDRIAATAAAGQVRDQDAAPPDEDGVMQLASLWSIDPTSLGRQFKEPVMGLLGPVAWAERRTGQ